MAWLSTTSSRCAALLAAAGCGGPADSGAASDARAPIVLLVVFDALAAGHVQHLGYERATTPHLDRLAADGLTCLEAVTPAPYTIAAIPGILSGLAPSQHGVLDKRGGLAASVETLAELLGAAGYATHAAVANANGGAAFGNDQGFDEFVALYDSAERPAGAVTRAEAALVVFEGWLERADAAARNFYYLHVLEPHAPYDPPAPYKARWIDARYAGPFAAGDVAPLVDAAHGKLEVGAEDVRAARDLYDANLAYADEVLGALLDLLRERGLYERALIVVTSDHGEAFWEHGAWGHNTQLYEEMVRVPLVAKLPRGAAGPPPGTRVEGLTSNLDVLPSICAWLGLASPAGIAGRAITSGGAFADADELRSLWMSTNTKKQPDVALRWRGGKAVFRCNPDTGAWLAIEWYEHAGDPGERRDLAAGRRVELDELGARASAEQRGLQRARAATHAAWSARFTAADERLLEHIGYVEDDGEPAAEPPDEPLGE